MRDKTCHVRQRGGGALSLFLPFTASDVLPKGSARGRISGSRSAVSGDLSPSISFSGLSGKRRKAGNREKRKKKPKQKQKQEKTTLIRCSIQWLIVQCVSLRRASAQFCVQITLSLRDIRGQLFTSWPRSSKTTEDTLTHCALLSLRSHCKIACSSSAPTQSTKT